MERVKAAITIEDDDLKKIVTYPTDLEGDLFNTTLAVQSPYQTAKINGEPYIVASWLPRYIKESKDTRKEITWDTWEAGTKFINPFKEENLLEDVAKVDVKDTGSALDFCNKYGLLGEEVNNRSNEVSGVDTYATKFRASAKESYQYFLNEILVIQGLLTIYHEITKPLRQQYESTKEEGFKLASEDMELKLKQGINTKLALVRPAINLDIKDGFLPSITTSSLLGAIYYRLYEVVTQGKEFRKCLNCGSLFIPRKANAKFCPPFQSGEHSSCQNSYNQMKSRARKAVKSDKKTIEEVANSIGRPLDEVRGWFS